LASFAEWPEVFSEGDTIEEARKNLFDALELVTEYHRDQAASTKKCSVVRETFELNASD